MSNIKQYKSILNATSFYLGVHNIKMIADTVRLKHYNSIIFCLNIYRYCI